MKQNSVKKWFIVQIRPNSYDLALRNLERQGLETFFPKMKATIKKENKFIYKDLPVFPGYAFIRFDLQNFNWTKINSTYGVSKILSFNNKPSEVPFDLIVALKNRFDCNIHPITSENLKKGDIIKFNYGPLVDTVVNIESVNANDRIFILLKFIGGYRKLEVNLKEKTNFVKIKN